MQSVRLLILMVRIKLWFRGNNSIIRSSVYRCVSFNGFLIMTIETNFKYLFWGKYKRNETVDGCWLKRQYSLNQSLQKQ